MRSLFRFPNPVDETPARVVATGVVFQTVVFLVFRQGWLLVPLAYGFVARVLTGPSLSPLGQLATRVVSPRIGGEHRLVPGPPKRFAQLIGATFTVAALVSWFTVSHVVAIVLVAMITVAASLEAAVPLCLGCIAFARLMRWGVIPADVCEACNDISGRMARLSSSTAGSATT